MIDLSIIILNYNTSLLLDKCLNSIKKNPPKFQFEVIVVDNSSSDNSISLVEKKYPEVLLIKNKVNLGYSKGNNLGIKAARGRNILILNSDTEIFGDSLTIMVKCLDNSDKVGILGPRLINRDNSFQKSAGKFYTPINSVIMLFGGERLGMLRKSPDKFTVFDWVSGACFMVKKEVFDKIGLFDEKMFMYMEEMEFCYRARKAGILSAYTNEARVYHKELGSSNQGKMSAIINIYQGLLYFYQKHYPNALGFIKSILKIKALIALFIGLITGNKHLSETYAKAYRLVG